MSRDKTLKTLVPEYIAAWKMKIHFGRDRRLPLLLDFQFRLFSYSS